MLRNALDIQCEAWPQTHPDTAKTLYDLGWAIADQRRFSEAASFFEQAAVMREALFGPDFFRRCELLGAQAIKVTTRSSMVAPPSIAWLGRLPTLGVYRFQVDG